VSEQLPGGGIELSPAEMQPLDARWSSCWDPSDVARHLAGVAVPRCVAAGWALDLFGGRQTREHGDIEVAIPAASFPVLRDRFPRYVFDGAGGGRIWEDATPDVLAATHQTWLRDPATGNYLLDVFREPHGDTWICGRDETIRLPYSEIIHHTDDGIPYLAPELVLADMRAMRGRHWPGGPLPGQAHPRSLIVRTESSPAPVISARPWLAEDRHGRC
jgi:hypothetical protein